MYFYARRVNQNGTKPQYLWVDMKRINDVLDKKIKPTEAYKYIEDRKQTMRWASEKALQLVLHYLDIDEGFTMERVPAVDLIPKSRNN